MNSDQWAADSVWGCNVFTSLNITHTVQHYTAQLLMNSKLFSCLQMISLLLRCKKKNPLSFMSVCFNARVWLKLDFSSVLVWCDAGRDYNTSALKGSHKYKILLLFYIFYNSVLHRITFFLPRYAQSVQTNLHSVSLLRWIVKNINTSHTGH